MSRALWDDDSFCPSCGHDRDASSVSSIDHGNGQHSCQMCGAKWLERTAVPDDLAERIGGKK